MANNYESSRSLSEAKNGDQIGIIRIRESCVCERE